MNKFSQRAGAAWLVGACALAPLLAIIGVERVMTRVERERLARGEISRSSTTFAEIDPHVAVSKKGVVAVSWMGVSRVEGEGVAARVVGTRVSQDGGATWEGIYEHRSPGEKFATDSMLAALPDGTFALTWLGFRANLARGGQPYDLGVYLAKVNAPDIWPVEVTAGLDQPGPHGKRVPLRFDKPWTAVTRDGAIVTSYRYEGFTEAGIRVSRSQDGARFEHTIVDSAPSFGGTLATICADPTSDRVVVAYPDALGRTYAKIVARWSDDGGATFPVQNTWIVTDQESAVVEAPSCAVFEKRMAIVYGVGSLPPSDASNALLDALVVARSSDGQKLTRAVYTDPNRILLHPAIVALPSGDLALLYVAGAHDRDDHATVRFARLTPIGALGEPAIDVLAPVPLATKRDPERGWTGDFQGLAATADGRLLAAIGDASGDSPHVLFKALAK